MPPPPGSAFFSPEANLRERIQNQILPRMKTDPVLDEERWELFTETERYGHSFQRGHEEGLAEGVDIGRCQTLRRAVLDVLELRGFEIPQPACERVESCESVEQLERWYAAAKSASAESLAQLLAH